MRGVLLSIPLFFLVIQMARGQCEFIYNDSLQQKKIHALTKESIGDKVLNNEMFFSFWKSHSLERREPVSYDLGNKRLSLTFILGKDKKVETVAYSMSEFKRTGQGFSSLVYSDQEVESLLDSLNLKSSITAFCDYLFSQSFPIQSAIYSLSLSDHLNGYHKDAYAAWLKVKHTKRPDTVRVISLKNFKLRDFPKELANFTNLTSLDLSGNYLSFVPKYIFKMKQLKTLNLSKNNIQADGLEIKKNKSIEILNIQANRFRTMPKRLRKLKKLNFLIAGRNVLDKVANYKFHRLKKLARLNLYSAYLKRVPVKLYKLKSLEELDLYYNKISELDSKLSKWKNLKTLALSFNNMSALPDELYQLESLEVLYAHHNRLKRLPSLPISIKVLDIGYNHFKDFPMAISSLDSLSELDYNGNNLDRAIDKLYLPKNLEIFYVSGNPLFNLREHKEESEAFALTLQQKDIILK